MTELHLDGAEKPFPGLMDLFAPLSALAEAPPSWIQRLVAARGIYLLTCPRDGSLYVGSAAAEGGSWQRWTDYRVNGHGGNVALIGRDPATSPSASCRSRVQPIRPRTSSPWTMSGSAS
ncbi:hypothetical protein [Sphingomonas sp. ID0503]|uniref:hypothetical protein n=1 Tax=Sphingomonas sp. ID0503 TaxID=3399691 RepID=UPI003AFB6844